MDGLNPPQLHEPGVLKADTVHEKLSENCLFFPIAKQAVWEDGMMLYLKWQSCNEDKLQIKCTCCRMNCQSSSQSEMQSKHLQSTTKGTTHSWLVGSSLTQCEKYCKNPVSEKNKRKRNGCKGQEGKKHNCAFHSYSVPSQVQAWSVWWVHTEMSLLLKRK